MFNFFKNIGNKLDSLFYNVTPRRHSPSDCFAFKNDEDKGEWYEECLDTKRSITGSDILHRIVIILCLLWALAIFGVIIVALIATTFF